MPPSDFSGRGGRCGTQVLSRNSGRPLSISADSASTVAVTASAGIGARPPDDAGIGLAARRLGDRLGLQRGEEGLGILERHVDARHRVEAGGGALARRPLAAHGGATGGLDRLLRSFGESGFAGAAWADYGRSGR